MPYLMGIAVPSTAHPEPIRALRHPGLARRDTHKVLIDDRCCLHAGSAGRWPALQRTQSYCFLAQ